ncbi:Uncharacterized protein PBTT_07341 [Plasmodiophora brassicae]
MMDPLRAKYMINPTQLAVTLASRGQCQLNNEIASTKHMLDKVAKVIADRICHSRHELKQKVVGSMKKNHGDAHNLPLKEFALHAFPPSPETPESPSDVNDSKIERDALLRAHRNKRTGFWQAIDKVFDNLDDLRSSGREDEADAIIWDYVEDDKEKFDKSVNDDQYEGDDAQVEGNEEPVPEGDEGNNERVPGADMDPEDSG